MEFVIIFFGSFILLGFGAWQYGSYEWRKAEKKEKQKQLELELKLAEEEKKPKCVIEFHVREQGIFNTNPIEPIISREDTVETSEEVSGKIIELSYKRGFFTDINYVTYPTCNIIKVYIKETKNE
jgi:hypothetical protein